MSKQTYIVDGIRTPIGSFGGALSPVRADDLAAFAVKSLMERHPNLDFDRIEDVILGCANQAGEDNRNIARMAGLLAGIPVGAGGETVNRLSQPPRVDRSSEGGVFSYGAGGLSLP